MTNQKRIPRAPKQPIAHVVQALERQLLDKDDAPARLLDHAFRARTSKGAQAFHLAVSRAPASVAEIIAVRERLMHDHRIPALLKRLRKRCRRASRNAPQDDRRSLMRWSAGRGTVRVLSHSR